VIEEPLKALDKLRKRKTFFAWKAMSPPVYGKLFHIFLYLSDGCQKFPVIQLAIIT
jgi:hypothetical protein